MSENEFIKNPKAKWYLELMARFDAIVENWSIPESAAKEFKIFLLEVAREQYMAGNRQAVSWAKKTFIHKQETT